MSDVPSSIHLVLEELKKAPDGYLKLPIPTPADAGSKKAVDTYLSSSSETRSQLRSALNDIDAEVFLVYGERMASAAVRQRSVETLFRGLLAAGLASGRVDYREVQQALAPLYRSAELLECDPVTLFALVADMVGADLPAWFRAFPARPDIGHILQSMQYVEGTGEEGFLYRRTWERLDGA